MTTFDCKATAPVGGSLQTIAVWLKAAEVTVGVDAGLEIVAF